MTKGARRLFNVPPPPAPTRPRGSSFDLLQRFLPCAVFIIKGKKLGSVFPQRKRFETRSKCIMRRVTYTYLYEGGRRGAIERNFFSWNFLVFFFFLEEKSRVSRSRARASDEDIVEMR